MNFLSGLYDYLMKINEKILRPFSEEDLDKINSFLIISVVDEGRFRLFMEMLAKYKKNSVVTIVAQDYIYDTYEKLYGDWCTVYSWHGSYTTELVEKIKNDIEISAYDAFVFFSEIEGNLRERNLLQLALDMNVLNAIVCSIGTELYQYDNIDLYLRITEIYDNINYLIEMEGCNS